MPLLNGARLVAVTTEAEQALGGQREVLITRSPFRIGRAQPAPRAENGLAGDPDDATDINDVYLADDSSGKSLHVSGKHFAIESGDDNFFLVDRHSACGTIVAGRRIGGNRKGGRTELRDGDEIIVGTSRSPYLFRFEVTR